MAYLAITYMAVNEEGNMENWKGRKKEGRNEGENPQKPSSQPDLCWDFKLKTNLHMTLINHY